MQPGDTVEHIKTGKRATVVDRSPSILTLKADGVTWNDPASYWRTAR